MELYLNSVKDNSQKIQVVLLENGQEVISRQAKARRAQAEKLLPLVEKVLKRANKSKKEIKKIIVKNKGDSFTSLRIGVVTANALAFALGVKIEGTAAKPIKKQGLTIVRPIYTTEPNIGLNKKNKV